MKCREDFELVTQVEGAQRAAEAAGQGNAELATRVNGQVLARSGSECSNFSGERLSPHKISYKFVSSHE